MFQRSTRKRKTGRAVSYRDSRLSAQRANRRLVDKCELNLALGSRKLEWSGRPFTRVTECVAPTSESEVTMEEPSSKHKTPLEEHGARVKNGYHSIHLDTAVLELCPDAESGRIW
jgi:hypothetical protein